MGILLAVAVSIGQWDEGTVLSPEYADQISKYVGKQEAEARAWVHANENLLRRGTVGVDVGGAMAELPGKDYTILLHRADSVVFWSNTRVMPPAALIEQCTSGRRLLNLPAGWYSAFSEPFDAETMTVLVPIRYTVGPAFSDNAALFPAGKNISKALLVSTTPTTAAASVQIDGKDLCWLSADGAVQSAALQWLKLLAYLSFLGVFLTVVAKAATWLTTRYAPVAGVALTSIVALGLIWLNGSTGFADHQFGALPAFEKPFSVASWLGATPGTWCISLLLLLWAAVFFHRKFELPGLEKVALPLKFAFAGAAYLLIAAGVLTNVRVFRHLIFDAGIYFDFNNFLNTKDLALLTLMGLMIWLLASFLFSHRLSATVQRLGLSRVQRGGLIGGATALIFAVALTMELPINALYIAGFALVFAGVLDAMVHWETPGFGWIVAWILLLSLFSAVLLYRFNDIKDAQIRKNYAAALASDRDTEAAEQTLPHLLTSFQADSQQLGLSLKPWPFKANAADLQAKFNTVVFQENYIFQHYRSNVFAFDRDNQPLLLGQTQGYAWVVQENWEQGQPLPGAPGIRFRTDADGKFRYMLRVSVRRMGDPTQPAQLYCFLNHEYPKPTRVYARLFFGTPYKDMADLARYDFAVQKNEKLLVEQGPVNLASLAGLLKNGEVRDVERPAQHRVDAVFKSADGNTLTAVGRTSGGFLKPIYLFAVLFTAISMLLLLLALANSLLRFLPDDYRLSLSASGSLARRIHYWNIVLIGLTFLVIGYMTYRHFTQTARDTERANLDYRAEALLNNLKSQVVSSTLSADSLRRSLPQTLTTMASSLSMDANFFSPVGDLQFTTQEELVKIGVLPLKMNPNALFVLRNNIEPSLVETEQTGGYSFFNKYLPLRDGQNRLLGFLGVPYDLAERKTGAEVSDFIGILASLYVFLLLIAYVVTYVLARNITKPIRLISEKISDLRLEDKNEPLEYAGDAEDEVGALIGQYNRMVDKLEDSKVQMIRLEREGAWREMARQVAHDIKNPLTTMKLSMQQLERVSSNPEQAAAYLRKAITRLIEQIDSLAQIASEFSMFANLEIKEKSDMVLNDAVESVYDLFSEQKNVSMELKLPKERFHIIGDKNHLIRVFNNLVINAIQAIPSDRQGHINVSIVRQQKYAVVRISDNGGGIPPEIRQRVFEPNFTTKTSGSGLGLAICRKIIEAHDGNIGFETRENEGTDFFVEMPISGVE